MTDAIKQTTQRSFACPICKTKLQRQSKTFPFCSERCQIIDLGRWADGSYSIAGEPVPSPESDEGYNNH